MCPASLPPQIRRLPARYSDPEVQAESQVIHQFNSAVAHTSSSASRSATPATTAPTTPVTVASQPACFTPSSGSFCSEASEQLSGRSDYIGDESLTSQAEPEVDIFDLDYTPKHNINLTYMYDSDTEQPKTRWVPLGVIGPPSYDNLSDCAKMILLQEMTRHMTFMTAVSFFMLTDTQIANFVHIYNREYNRKKTEEELLETAISRIIRIRMQRDMLDIERQIIFEEEVIAKLPALSCLLSITKPEIEKAIAFLESFRVQEEHSAIEIQTPNGLRIVGADDIPPYLVIAEIVEGMRRYARLGISFVSDQGHDMGLWDYLVAEMGMVCDADDEVFELQYEVADKDEDETWQPTRRPVGRPRGSKNNGGRRPSGNRSGIIKLRVPSGKLQDIERVSSAKRLSR
ncbi:hypothetical protein ACMFMG_003439 [Clarireedia jacksonii]